MSTVVKYQPTSIFVLGVIISVVVILGNVAVSIARHRSPVIITELNRTEPFDHVHHNNNVMQDKYLVNI